jgi:hypothetical protein
LHPPSAVLAGTIAVAILGSRVADAVAMVPTIGQGVTTAAVRGTVRMSDGSDPDGARVSVRNTATGFEFEAEVRRGRFLVQGLEVGGPYTVTLRRIGAQPEQRTIGFLSLGEPYELQLVLHPAPLVLDSLVTTATRANRFPSSNAHGGTASSMGDSLIHHLPSLNRNLYDFVRLVPQISTKVGLAAGGISGGGVGFRLNNFLTNGVPERSLAGNQPPEFAGGKSLPLEAVAEYQVLLAPFDVRYGDFAGATVNTVTRSGTNQLLGSVFARFRNDALARSGQATPYEQELFGFSLSGPIARDRVHFLVASEFQRLTSPMQGPYLGQPAGSTEAVPVRAEDLARFETIMRGYGLTAGSGGAVENRNPVRNLFARLDAALPSVNTRAVFWVSDAQAENLQFARTARDPIFPLSTQASRSGGGTQAAALQLHTALRRRGGGHNELFVSGRAAEFGATSDVRQPIVAVAVPAATGGGLISLISGTADIAQAGNTHYRSFDLRDNLTLPLGGSHLANVGVEAEWFRIRPEGLASSFGTWTFPSLDALEAGLAERFEVTRDFGSGSTALTGAQYAAYGGDQWQPTDHLTLTLGLRADRLDLTGHAPYNRAVDSIFGRRTDQSPNARVEVSPRVGLTWTPGGTGRDQIRGGLGIFTGRPPLAWFHLPLQAYGFGTGILRCGQRQGDQGPPPAFVPDPLAPPTACVGGGTGTPLGDVELVDRQLRMARTLRGVVAWDHWLPGGLLATGELLVTRNLSDFMFVNLNLAGPQSVDQRGRTLYGTVAPSGRATPVLRDSRFPGVVEIQNVSVNHSIQASARFEKRFSSGIAAMASYSWSRVRDGQTPLRVNNRGIVNWSSRALSGRHDDLSAGVSLNDVPHRIVVAGTWRAPWSRWTTEVSVLYVGESGSPFTYLTFGTRAGLGDLNADGSSANDPIYVPRNASDPTEIGFTGRSSDPLADSSSAAQASRVAAQQVAFDQFIDASPCLNRQRGRILERNSCREPWSHTSVLSIHQRMAVVPRGLELELDLFNPLNLVRRSWGLRRVAQPALLEHVGQTIGPGGTSEPVFRFSQTGSPWTIVRAESAFQLQFGVTYRF